MASVPHNACSAFSDRRLSCPPSNPSFTLKAWLTQAQKLRPHARFAAHSLDAPQRQCRVSPRRSCHDQRARKGTRRTYHSLFCASEATYIRTAWLNCFCARKSEHVREWKKSVLNGVLHITSGRIFSQVCHSSPSSRYLSRLSSDGIWNVSVTAWCVQTKAGEMITVLTIPSPSFCFWLALPCPSMAIRQKGPRCDSHLRSADPHHRHCYRRSHHTPGCLADSFRKCYSGRIWCRSRCFLLTSAYDLMFNNTLTAYGGK